MKRQYTVHMPTVLHVLSALSSSQDARVARWDHREKVDPSDPEGCGTPVCSLIDARPKRFESLCGLARHVQEKSLKRQFFTVQKGDCADASE